MEEFNRVSAVLGVEEEAPQLDDRTFFWINAFNLACRARPPSMGGIPCLSPVTIMDMAERLHWPCEPEECVHVICAMDDDYRERNAKD